MELKQKRFVYEKAFSVERVVQNLKTYQVATGEAEPSVLCKRKHDSHGVGEKDSVAAERKRRRRRKYKERRQQTKRPREWEEDEEGSSEVFDGKAENTVKSTSESTSQGESGSLGVLAAQYSSSEEEEEASPSHTQKESTSWETLPVPDAILGMYTGEGVSSESGDSGEKGGGEREVCGLGFFETCQSSSDDDEGEKTKTKTPATPPVKKSSAREKWDETKAKWKFPVSKLQTFVCANCGKVGHFTQDCTVGSTEKEPPKIPTNLKALYSKARKLTSGKDTRCADCGITTNLVCCLDCSEDRVTFSVVASFERHKCGWSGSYHSLYKPMPVDLKHVNFPYCETLQIKCCNSLCPTVSIYDLYICSHCLGSAFSHHYSMITACWSSAGLRKIQNAIACENHFHWHRVNCPSSAEEQFVTREKLQQTTLSEFFF